ncbi:M4 family metallopeptidase [Brachybacterium sp. AOP25-B2-12]|uniref:M4 family metallopeptidase n=1 Tax=Brachybacterium sp. AOP25-B2-12 TaxID=3457710 RepID=UPI00403368ED
MATTPRTATRCSIIPPHLLHRLAEDADPYVARCAQHTLQGRIGLEPTREVRSATGPGRTSPGATGFVPPQLGGRTQSLRADTVPAPTVPSETSTPPAPDRSIHDAQHGTDLPGPLARREGQDPVADESVNEAYDGLGSTFELFAEVYGRDSLDGRGLPLVASVHYDRDFQNAFWDGRQMVFGDGDGEVFTSFTDSVDVIAHELTHGFTQYTAGLTYVGQSGALNESVSDVFGALVAQRLRGQTAAQADWLIGAGLFTDRVHAVALRSMKAPGTAYDDPVLGVDPQPATMADYQVLPHDEDHDNGGVHINSGIPNHAFYLAAVAIGGHAWEGAGRIWYDVMTSRTLPKDASFATFAAATVVSAEARFGAGGREADAVRAAWQEVEVS